MAFNPTGRSKRLGRYETAVEVGKAPLGAQFVAVRDEEPRAALLRLIETEGLAKDTLDRLSEAAWWALDARDPHVLSAQDVVLGEGQLGTVAEYVEGENLRALLRLSAFKKRPAELPVALGIVLDLARGVRALELQAEPLSGGRGLLLANGNVAADHLLIGSDGVARIADPGVLSAARRIERFSNTVELTQYSAPEQLESGNATSASDVFVLGVVLWELLSGGKHLFIGTAKAALAERIRGRDVPRLDQSGFGKVPKAVADVVACALSRDVSARFRDVEELRCALEELGERATPEVTGKWVRDLAGTALTLRAKQLERALAAPSGARAATGPTAARPLAATPAAAVAPMPIAASVVPPITPPTPVTVPISFGAPTPRQPEAEELEELDTDELVPESVEMELEPESAVPTLSSDELEPESLETELEPESAVPTLSSDELEPASEPPTVERPVSSQSPGQDAFALHRLEPVAESTRAPEPTPHLPAPTFSVPAPPLREPSSFGLFELPRRWLIVGAAAAVVILTAIWLLARSASSREQISAAAAEDDTRTRADVKSAAAATSATPPDAAKTPAAPGASEVKAEATPSSASSEAPVKTTAAKAPTTTTKTAATKTVAKTTTAKTATTKTTTTTKTPTKTTTTKTTTAKTTAKATTTTKATSKPKTTSQAVSTKR